MGRGRRGFLDGFGRDFVARRASVHGRTHTLAHTWASEHTPRARIHTRAHTHTLTGAYTRRRTRTHHTRTHASAPRRRRQGRAHARVKVRKMGETVSRFPTFLFFAFPLAWWRGRFLSVLKVFPRHCSRSSFRSRCRLFLHLSRCRSPPFFQLFSTFSPVVFNFFPHAFSRVCVSKFFKICPKFAFF